MGAAVESPDLVVLREVVAGAHQLDVLRYERGAAARVHVEPKAVLFYSSELLLSKWS
jgi:hypothetical protein